MISKLLNFFVTNVNVELKHSDINDPLLKYQATFKKDFFFLPLCLCAFVVKVF